MYMRHTLTVRQLLNVLDDDARIYLVNYENENECLHFVNGEIKFMDIRPYLSYKIISVKPIVCNEIRIEYKKENN